MITVVDYDPTWPCRFEALRQEYAEAMATAGVPVIAIEHVGSDSWMRHTWLTALVIIGILLGLPTALAFPSTIRHHSASFSPA